MTPQSSAFAFTAEQRKRPDRFWPFLASGVAGGLLGVLAMLIAGSIFGLQVSPGATIREAVGLSCALLAQIWKLPFAVGAPLAVLAFMGRHWPIATTLVVIPVASGSGAALGFWFVVETPALPMVPAVFSGAVAWAVIALLAALACLWWSYARALPKAA